MSGTRWLVIVAAVCIGCGRDSHSSTEHTARAARDVGRAVGQGAQSVGHGIVCGVRRIGQVLSGTQGDPHAEALSREDCSKAEIDANRAQQAIERAGHELREAPAPRSIGGGPSRRER